MLKLRCFEFNEKVVWFFSQGQPQVKLLLHEIIVTGLWQGSNNLTRGKVSFPLVAFILWGNGAYHPKFLLPVRPWQSQSAKKRLVIHLSAQLQSDIHKLCFKRTEQHKCWVTNLFGKINEVVCLINKKELQRTSSVIEISQVKFSQLTQSYLEVPWRPVSHALALCRCKTHRCRRDVHSARYGFH